MKIDSFFVALSGVASAHYVFPQFIQDGEVVSSKRWAHVRQTTNWMNNHPIKDINSPQFRCYELNPGQGAPEVLEVEAGSELGVTVFPRIIHPGAVQFWMAQVPESTTAADWDAEGEVWFKIHEEGPVFGGNRLVWPTYYKKKLFVDIPKALPDGEYLLRIEHIALHYAAAVGGVEFYIGCGQVKITNGGNGTPGPKVAFPGAYDARDPGLHWNINAVPLPTSYTPPGPRPWLG